VFINNVSPSWLIIIDESMVKWVGVGMPGVMVVPQKPTPMGLELHTVCCAVSGILINFELYEGKERMGLKQCVGEPTEFGPINKSTALPLRCVQPWFSTVRPRAPYLRPFLFSFMFFACVDIAGPCSHRGQLVWFRGLRAYARSGCSATASCAS